MKSCHQCLTCVYRRFDAREYRFCLDLESRQVVPSKVLVYCGHIEQVLLQCKVTSVTPLMWKLLSRNYPALPNAPTSELSAITQGKRMTVADKSSL